MFCSPLKQGVATKNKREHKQIISSEVLEDGFKRMFERLPKPLVL